MLPPSGPGFFHIRRVPSTRSTTSYGRSRSNDDGTNRYSVTNRATPEIGMSHIASSQALERSKSGPSSML